MFVFCFIEGARYKVGTDWVSYQALFLDIQQYGLSFKDVTSGGYEPLYIIFNYLVAKAGLTYQWFFGLAAGLQVGLFTLAMRQLPRQLPLAMFVYATTFLISSQNILRQTIATTVFLFALTALARGERVRYLCGSVCAFLTHFSSAIVLPFVVIGNKIFRWLDNVWVGIASLAVSFTLGPTFINIITQLLPIFTSNRKYISNLDELDIVHDYATGLGHLFSIFLTFLIVLFFKKMKESTKGFNLTLYYRIFLVGSILQNAFANSMLLARVPFALSATKMILLPVCYAYLWRKSSWHKLLCITLLLISVAGYFMTISSRAADCAPFLFKF